MMEEYRHLPDAPSDPGTEQPEATTAKVRFRSAANYHLLRDGKAMISATIPVGLHRFVRARGVAIGQILRNSLPFGALRQHKEGG